MVMVMDEHKSPSSMPLNNQPTAINQQWILQSVLPRQEFFTKEIRRLLRGGVVAGMQMPRNPECCPRQSRIMKPA